MKKIILCSAVLFCSWYAGAQVSYGVMGGLQHIDARVKIFEGPVVPVRPGYGFHVGAFLKVPFDKDLYFVPQLLYSLKGFTVQYNNALRDSVVNNKLEMHYVEIPALLQFDTRNDGEGIFFQFGPSVSVAFGGTDKKTFLNGKERKNPVKFANTAYGRFEMNLVGKIGYQVKDKWFVAGGYAFGLGNIVNDDLSPRIAPRMITVSAGFFFPGKL
ncbi:MAG: porin family protein [Agriterribacter sp.]